MKLSEIDNVELKYLKMSDFKDLKGVMESTYKDLPDAYWTEQEIKTLLKKFPEGQVIIKVNGQMAGCALSIIVDYDRFNGNHTYKQVTGNYTFNTHDDNAELLYGVDVIIKPEFRGLRLGRRLYDYRKELCEKLNLKGIAFGGRIPNYHKYADELTPKQYIEKVRKTEIHDPVLNFQISNDFHPSKVLKGYLEGDEESNETAVLM